MRQLHWTPVPRRIDFKVLSGVAPSHLSGVGLCMRSYYVELRRTRRLTQEADIAGPAVASTRVIAWTRTPMGDMSFNVTGSDGTGFQSNCV